VCPRCAGEHQFSDCPSNIKDSADPAQAEAVQGTIAAHPIKCVNCGASHSSAYKLCPVFLKNKEIVEIKTINRVTYADAARMYSEKRPLGDGTITKDAGQMRAGTRRQSQHLPRMLDDRRRNELGEEGTGVNPWTADALPPQLLTGTESHHTVSNRINDRHQKLQARMHTNNTSTPRRESGIQGYGRKMDMVTNIEEPRPDTVMTRERNMINTDLAQSKQNDVITENQIDIMLKLIVTIITTFLPKASLEAKLGNAMQMIKHAIREDLEAESSSQDLL